MSDTVEPQAPAEDSSVEAPSAPSEEGLAPPDSQPTQDTQPEEGNLEQRLSDTQAWAHELTQQQAQIEQVLEAARQGDPQALQALGFEMSDPNAQGEPLDEYQDPIEELSQQMQEMRQHLEQQQLSQQDQEWTGQLNDYVDQELDKVQEKHGREFSPQAMDAIEALAYTNPIQLEDGTLIPNVEGAYQTLYKEILDAERQNWVQSKQADQPGSGTSGSKQVDLRDDQQRKAALAQAIEESQGAT